MKRIIYTFLMGLLCMVTAIGQPDNNLILNLPESGNQLHQATNSITFNPGYSYTTAGGTLLAEIVNPYINGIVAYNPFIDPATRSLIQTSPYLVGTSNGSFDVNGIGGASYSIPIDLPQGANGLAPSITLVYSSSAGSGIAGYGWQISGISVIGRTGQTIYNEGKTTGINLTGEDRFTLDGQRLILTSGNYGADMATYQTEIDGFSRIQSQLSSGSGPAKFMVQTKSGLKLNYGTYDDACQRITDISEVINWYISEMSDLYGNMVSYKYIRNNNMIYPSEINYGPNKITFFYKERTDKTVTYLKGQKIEQNLLLDKIIITYNNNTVKKYELKYNKIEDNSNTYSILNEVVEFGTDNSQLNSTVFSYQTPANVIIDRAVYNTTHNFISYKSSICSGDFNGDGKADLFSIDNAGVDVGNYSGWKLQIGIGNGYFNEYSGDFPIAKDKIRAMYSVDLNGDGLEDLIIKEDIGVCYWQGVLAQTDKYHYAISTGTSFNSPIEIGNAQNSSLFTQLNNSQSGDFNGDGLNDILLIHKTEGNWSMYSFTYTNGQLNPLSKTASGIYTSFNDDSNQFVGDWDGDGIAEIVTIDQNGTGVYKQNGDLFTKLYHPANPPRSGDDVVSGDFNGDGNIDLLVYSTNKVDMPNWNMYLSTGTGFELFTIPQKKSNLKDDIVRTGDFNGDGCTDLMVTDKLTDGETNHHYYLSKNKGKDFYDYNLQVGLSKLPNYLLDDYDGDGRTDFLFTDGSSDGNWWNGYMIYWQTDGKKTSPLMEKVANGINHLTTIAYTKLSQASSSIYQKGAITASFPVFNFQGPLPVVSSVIASNGLSNGNNEMHYYYEGAKIHRQGKGFLCFSNVGTTDVSSNLVMETQTEINSTYYYPQVNTITQKVFNGPIFTKTSNTWQEKVLDAASKRIFPYVSTSTQINIQTGDTIKTEVSNYDNYGNPNQITKTYDNGVSETTVNSYTNTINGTDWKLGRIDNSTITYGKSGETPVVHTTSYTYGTDGILKPDIVYYYKNTPLEYYKNHDYDSKGNIIQEYTSGSSIGDSQVNYAYDNFGINILTSTDELGHTTTYKYDAYARLISEKNYLNDTITYGYDALSRQILVKNTSGNKTTTTFVWTGTNKPLLAVYGITKTQNDGSLSTEWFDKLDRQIRAEKTGFDGQMIITDTEYNLKGQLYRVSRPYFAGETFPGWSQTYSSYDEFGRVKAIDRDAGGSSTYDYSANRVTENREGKISWKETDSQGLTVKANDKGGDIVYTYFPDGKVKTITAPGGVVTRMQYADAARNQTQLSDPSAGTINYTYDSFGRINTQTDTEGRVTTYKYLPDGRADKKITPEETISYSYNQNKQLTDIGSSNNVSRIYAYDPLGKVTSISENINGVVFSTTFSYDDLGRLSARLHPSGIKETLKYNDYGYLASFSAGGTTYFTITSKNSREQLTGATYGSDLKANFEFDPAGYPTYIETGTIQGYNYSFVPWTGNLTYRWDYLKETDMTEVFDYDDFDRLTDVSGPQPLNMTYGDNGNIATKSDIGTTAFSYGLNAGPYALTGVASPTRVIAVNTQTIGYNSFQKVNTISEGDYGATFTYNSDQQRVRMDITQRGANILTRWYGSSNYMKETAGSVTKEYTYIGGDAYSAPVVAVTQGGVPTYYYLLRDYLGNITHQVNTSNTVVAEYSFDAWGRRRNPVTWSYDLTGQPELFADRGFTGHEHLKWFNLINMNGRLYDPAVGRFLNVDPYVQMPDYTQNFNRYSYCLNNPLKYTDPNGEIIFTLMALLIPGGQVFLPYAIAADISWMTDYGMQVGMNYANGYKGSDAWLKKIDWFDVGVSAVIGGATGGASAELKAGKELSKFANFMAKNAKLVTMGEMALTSAIDITGEGWQPVSFNDIGKRFAINLLTLGASEVTSDLTKKLVKKPATKASMNALGTSRDNLLNSAENPKLRNIVNDLHRPGAQIGSGSSMDAFRLENLTGELVGGKSHFQKLIDYRTALQKLWNNKSMLSTSDKQIVKLLMGDIQNALSGN